LVLLADQYVLERAKRQWLLREKEREERERGDRGSMFAGEPQSLAVHSRKAERKD
jgi:hypothetical protein